MVFRNSMGLKPYHHLARTLGAEVEALLLAWRVGAAQHGLLRAPPPPDVREDPLYQTLSMWLGYAKRCPEHNRFAYEHMALEDAVRKVRQYPSVTESLMVMVAAELSDRLARFWWARMHSARLTAATLERSALERGFSSTGPTPLPMCSA